MVISLKEVGDAVVALSFYIKDNKQPAATKWSGSTGFVVERYEDGFFILTTFHQLVDLYKSSPGGVAAVPDDEIGVRVSFLGYQGVEGYVVHRDDLNDLCLISVDLDESVLSIQPLVMVQPLEFYDDTVFPSQRVYSVHHPSMILRGSAGAYDQQSHVYYQYTEGYVVDPDLPELMEPGSCMAAAIVDKWGKGPSTTATTRVQYDVHKLVQYELPLVMHGSSGSPVVDTNTGYLVCMVKGADPIGDQLRHYGIPVATIKKFYNDYVDSIQSVNTSP